MTRTKKLLFNFALVSLLSVSGLGASRSLAETLDFGGHDERFRGRGNLTPPQCQVQAPDAAGAPFEILWYCNDDDTADPDIRTELWVLPKGGLSWEHVRSFLGKPSGMLVSPAELHSTSVKEGLPATFRVVALDRAGNTTISPALTINAGDSSSLTCDLTITTTGTDTSTTGDTTGVPSQTVFLSAVPSEIILSTASTFLIQTSAAGVASPCEIDSICQNDSKVQFAGSGTISSGTSFELSVSPGNFSASLSGSVDGTTSLSGATFSGDTTFEDLNAHVDLSCGASSGGTTGTGTTGTTGITGTTGTDTTDTTDTTSTDLGAESTTILE